MEKCGIYIHIPFCASKCIYCDFFSAGVRRADWAAYVKALENELVSRKGELRGELSTLYIGGGTPSLMEGGAFQQLVEMIYRVTGKRHDWDEFTIEVNPEDVTEDLCRLWSDAGVTRVSMGIQSFNDGELKTLNRRHDSERARNSARMLRENFGNVSLDLMFGLPGQTMDSWKESIERTLSVSPDHISAYSLMLEPGTPLTLLHQQGKISLPEEDASVEMFRYLSERLDEAGFIQYEISNYSRPGYESLHNRRYWLGNPYLGLGPGAHSYDGDRIRKGNPAKLSEYLRHFENYQIGISPFYEEEHLSDTELLEERILLAMRMREGLDLDTVRSRFGDETACIIERRARKLEKRGLLALKDGRITLTKSGVMLADEAILELLP